MLYAKPRICPVNWGAQNTLGFWDANKSPNSGQTTIPIDRLQEKWELESTDFAMPADYRVKVKEGKKRDNYLDLKKKRNMKVTVIATVIDALVAIPKKEGWRSWKLEDGQRPSKPQHRWGWPEYWKDPRRPEETCNLSDSSERPSADVDVKNSLGIIIIIIIIIISKVSDRSRGGPKAPFSITTTPLCRGSVTPFPGLLHFSCAECSWYSHQRIGTRTGGLRNYRTIGDSKLQHC